MSNKDGEIGYSGPTFIAIRSSKHAKNCAESHMSDFQYLTSLDEFKSTCKKEDKLKPLIFVSVDGGPHEAPKNRQSSASWSKTFIENDIDAIFVFTHLAGNSAYNPVERRMAPLSKDVASIILPFDTYVSNLRWEQQNY